MYDIILPYLLLLMTTKLFEDIETLSGRHIQVLLYTFDCWGNADRFNQ